MTEQNKFRFFSIESLYPTPEIRKKGEVPAMFKIGNLVEALVGPATGRVGVVVVDRNGNFEDHEPYASEDSIGVMFAEKEELDKVLQNIVETLIDHEAGVKTVVRWFDNPSQLKLVPNSNLQTKEKTPMPPSQL